MDGQGLRRKIGKEASFQVRVLQYTRTCLCLCTLHFLFSILLEETDDLDYLLAFIYIVYCDPSVYFFLREKLCAACVGIIIDYLRTRRSYHLQPDKTIPPPHIHLQSTMTSQVSINSSTLPSAYYDPKGGTAINANFDSGNILVESVDSDCVTLRLRSEPFTEGTDKRCHSQWFYFRSSQIKGRSMSYRIVNAGQASYPAGFKNYKTCASYDGEHWYRVHDTTYDEAKGILLWNHYSTRHGLVCLLSTIYV